MSDEKVVNDGHVFNAECGEPIYEKTQKDVLAHSQAKFDALPPGTVLVPPATCPVCGANPCDSADNHEYEAECGTAAERLLLKESGYCLTEAERRLKEALEMESADDDVKSVSFDESFERETRVSAFRTRLETTGYKSIWQTETINHAGDRTVVSSWVPVGVPTDRDQLSPKAYKASIYEDIILVERNEGVDGIYPGEYCGSSIYIHGIEPIVNPRLFLRWEQEQREDDETEEWHKAADAVEAAAGEGEHYSPCVDYCPKCGTFYVLAESVCGSCGTPRR